MNEYEIKLHSFIGDLEKHELIQLLELHMDLNAHLIKYLSEFVGKVEQINLDDSNDPMTLYEGLRPKMIQYFTVMPEPLNLAFQYQQDDVVDKFRKLMDIEAKLREDYWRR